MLSRIVVVLCLVAAVSAENFHISYWGLTNTGCPAGEVSSMRTWPTGYCQPGQTGSYKFTCTGTTPSVDIWTNSDCTGNSSPFPAVITDGACFLAGNLNGTAACSTALLPTMNTNTAYVAQIAYAEQQTCNNITTGVSGVVAWPAGVDGAIAQFKTDVCLPDENSPNPRSYKYTCTNGAITMEQYDDATCSTTPTYTNSYFHGTCNNQTTNNSWRMSQYLCSTYVPPSPPATVGAPVAAPVAATNAPVAASTNPVAAPSAATSVFASAGLAAVALIVALLL